MYVGLKQPRGDGERYVTPARAAAKETTITPCHAHIRVKSSRMRIKDLIANCGWTKKKKKKKKNEAQISTRAFPLESPSN